MLSTTESLALKAVLTGFASGLLSICVTRLVEKLGGVKGSLIGFLPTIVVPTSVGFALVAESNEAFQSSMLAIPCTMMVNDVYLYLWRLIPERMFSRYSKKQKLLFTFSLTFLFWCAMAASLLVILTQVVQPAGILYVWIFSVISLFVKLSAGCYVMLYHTTPTPPKKSSVSSLALFFRALAMGAVITMGIVVSFYNHFAGGIISFFPALFATTMVSLWLSQGESVQTGAVGPMMVASTSVSVYCFIISLLYPHLPIAASAPLAWILSVIYQIPIAFFLFRVAAKKTKESLNEKQMNVVDGESQTNEQAEA